VQAATNHSDFIEFDVHVTRDGVVVVHHDFEVQLAVGSETLAIGIPSLTSRQLQR
jgi:glycerophosphoryl diester phosphodiesterase